MISVITLIFFLNNQGPSHQLKADLIDSRATGKHQLANEYIYGGLNETLGGSFVIVGLDGSVRYISSEFTAETGYSDGEMLNSLIFNYIQDEDLPTFIEGFGKVLETESPITMVGPFNFTLNNNTSGIFMATLTPIIEDGKVKEIVVETKDIKEELLDNEESDKEETEGKESAPAEKDNPQDNTETKNENSGPKIQNINNEDSTTRLIGDKLAQVDASTLETPK